MGTTDPVVKSVKALSIPLIEFESTDGFRYVVNLERFKSVYCFPESQSEWEQVFQMDGDRIVWKNRFEVHVDQAIVNIVKKEKISGALAS